MSTGDVCFSNLVLTVPKVSSGVKVSKHGLFPFLIGPAHLAGHESSSSVEILTNPKTSMSHVRTFKHVGNVSNCQKRSNKVNRQVRIYKKVPLARIFHF